MSNIDQIRARWLLPFVLSATAGAVDVIGFLALGGLFTAHITGNIVVLAAHYITGSFGQICPLLAVPVFVVVLGIVTVTCCALRVLGQDSITKAATAPRCWTALLSPRTNCNTSRTHLPGFVWQICKGDVDT